MTTVINLSKKPETPHEAFIQKTAKELTEAQLVLTSIEKDIEQTGVVPQEWYSAWERVHRLYKILYG